MPFSCQQVPDASCRDVLSFASILHGACMLTSSGLLHCHALGYRTAPSVMSLVFTIQSVLRRFRMLPGPQS